MRVWLAKDAEPLPIGGESHRMRMGRLADALVAAGHDVTWFHSTFYHFAKRRFAGRAGVREIAPNYRLHLIEAGEYAGNVSPARWRHHRALARGFAEASAGLASPDVIVAAFPIPWLAHAAVVYARERGVPCVVDVRDLWPDVFVHKSPPGLRPLVRLATVDLGRRTAWLLRQADAIVGVSAGYLRWALERAGREASALDRVIPLGYGLPAHPDDRGPEQVLPPGLADRLGAGTIVSFAGSFGRSYDLSTVCEAAARLAAGGRDDIRFVIAGDGEQRRSLARRAAALPNVALPGWLEKAQMDALLARSHLGLVCCRSVSDTVPNKVFQYLAFGLPLLSSLEGEGRELIETCDLGLSYPAGDAAALARAVVSLADAPDRRRACSANARRVFGERYEASGIDRTYRELVESVARRGHPASKLGSALALPPSPAPEPADLI